MIKQAFLAVLLAASLQPAAAFAASTDETELRARTVYFGDLDLSDNADASALLSRLGRAAERVCSSDGRQPVQVRRQMRQCKAAALDAAVSSVKAPKLNALHQGDAPLRQLASR